MCTTTSMSKHDKAWNCRFRQLLEYRHMHGNCSVPLRYRSNPSLGRWVNRQREAKGKQMLSWEREVILNDIGKITLSDDSCYTVVHL
jgi:hypothetical protein